MEYGPFNFDSYDDEDYYFDCDGAYARHYVFGGKEATSAVHKTLYEFRSAARRIAKATGQDPNHSDHLIEVPADAPQPEDIYGYQALRWIFGSEQAARVAAWAAAQYHREQAALAGEDDPALRPRPHDGPALPIKDRHLYTSSDPSAEEEYPEDRSPAELGRDPPDSKEKPWWADLIKEGRRARANGYSTPGYSWSPIPPMIVIPRRPQPGGAPVLRTQETSAPSAVKHPRPQSEQLPGFLFVDTAQPLVICSHSPAGSLGRILQSESRAQTLENPSNFRGLAWP